MACEKRSTFFPELPFYSLTAYLPVMIVQFMCNTESAEDLQPEYEFEPNTYEKFMRKHLQHYGYYTGRNQGYRHKFERYSDWEKADDFTLMSDSSDSESDLDEEDDKQDNKLQEEILRTTQLIYSYEAGRMVPRLREPRNLYALAKEHGPQQAARWPSDAQVLKTCVKHIRYVPPNPEKFYQPTGQEHTPMVRGEEYGGRLVYEYDTKGSFFVRSCVGGTKNGYSTCCVPLVSEQDQTLLFESRFEGGNLAKAVQVGEFDYELWLKYDYYTQKHIQWFYFMVSNTRANKPYRFTIVNFMKPDSLYNTGMKPLMYSEREAEQNNIGWERSGDKIKYYRNNKSYSTSKGDKPLFSLTWTVEFTHDKDEVYFAHCYPYSYSDLQDYLLELSNDPMKSKICKQRVLCRTLAGNLVYILTITSPSQNPHDIKYKKAVVITARVHPGESNSSWMMKGFLDYLTGHSADAKLLRDTFVFKIVPMLNPDGVIVGNYRCSLSGRDLNRNYKTVLKDSFPPVWHTRNMIKRLMEEREIIVYCDLHGHSRKQNVFIYGCENRYSANRRLRERIFPMMLHKNAPDKFSFDSCKFKIQKSKEGTGRVVMWNMGIMNSFTMEATFCGSTLGKKKGYHFSVVDFEMMGYHFCDTLLDYCDPDNSKAANIYLDLEERLKKEILVRLENQGMSTEEIDLSDDYVFGLESTDGGSDSSGSDGLPIHLQYLTAQSSKKKKKLRSRKERDRQRLLKEAGKKTSSASNVLISAEGQKQGDKNGIQSQSNLSKDKGTLTAHRYPDDRNNNHIPIFIQERCENRQARRNEYLEALTRTYIQNGVLAGPESGTPHFRYSGNKLPAIPFNMEGLCVHHEQALAAQYMTHQLRSLQPPVCSMLSLVGQPVGREPRPVSHPLGRLRRVRSDTAANFLRKLKNVQTGGENTIEEFIHGNTYHTDCLPSERASSGVAANGLPPQRHLLEIVVAREREQFIENLKKKADKSESDGLKSNELSPEQATQKINWIKGRALSVTPIHSESSNSVIGQSHSNGLGSIESIDVADRGRSGSHSKLSGDKTPESDPNGQVSSVKPRKTSGGKKKKKSSAANEEDTLKTEIPKFSNTTVLGDIPKKSDASSNKKKSFAKTSKLDIPVGYSQNSPEPDNIPFLTQARELVDTSSTKLEKYSPRAGRNGRESVNRKDVRVTHPTDQIVIQAKSCRTQQQSPTNRSKSSMDSPREQHERSPRLKKNALSLSHGQINKHSESAKEKENIKSQPSSPTVKSTSSNKYTSSPVKSTSQVSKSSSLTSKSHTSAKSTTPTSKSRLTPSASHYINKLMQEADQEIRELTTELEEDVKRERKLVKHLQTQEFENEMKEVGEGCEGSGGSEACEPAPGDEATDWAGRHVQVHESMYESADSHCNTATGITEDTVLRKESFCRSKSGKQSKRELVGAAPTKISLMISNDHRDLHTEQPAVNSRHFLPASRHTRAAYLRHNTRRN